MVARNDSRGRGKNRGSLFSRLRLLKLAEVRRALPAKELRQREKDLQLAITRARAKVCSGSWGDWLIHGEDVSYPPRADDPACQMRRAFDLDHVVALQSGQSRDRLFPGIYVNHRGYSGDAVIEDTESRRMNLIGLLGGELHRRRSSVAVRVMGGEMQYAESR
jgi:hypothetical protein